MSYFYLDRFLDRNKTESYVDATDAFPVPLAKSRDNLCVKRFRPWLSPAYVLGLSLRESWIGNCGFRTSRLRAYARRFSLMIG